MKQWFFLWVVAIGISITLTTLSSCTKHKNIPSTDLPAGEIVGKSSHQEIINVYEFLIQTSYGLERVEVDSDLYNYANITDSIVIPQ